MDKRLSSYHAIQELSSRIPDRLDDLTIRMAAVSSKARERRQDRIQPRPANTGLRRVSIDTPFEFDSTDDRH
jgi:hypothetical protein